MISYRLVSMFIVVLAVKLSSCDEIFEEELTSPPKIKLINLSALYKSIRALPCKPQPRAFIAKNHLTEPLQASEKLTPTNFILHICDEQSGCCEQDGEVCGLHSYETVTIQLEAKDTFTDQKRNLEITAINHTMCKCDKRRSGTGSAANFSELTSGGLRRTQAASEYTLVLCALFLMYFIQKHSS